MYNIRELLGNATMAYTNMKKNVDCKKVVKSIFDLLQENKKNIEEANQIDVKNNNGFKIDFNMINKLKREIEILHDSYRRVVELHKNENNYLEGKQTDNLGTICLIYDGNTYCLLEIVLKSILTHNSIIITSEADYMKGTNELIVILIKRILEAYEIDKNLVQILYTTNLEELLANSASINKVICIGNRSFQNMIKQVSKIPVICKGYNAYDLYIEDLTHLDFVEKIIEDSPNIDIYVKSGLEVPFEDYIEVADCDEAIAQINFNSAGFSSCIFTDNSENASQFLREVKTDNVSVNSSPLLEKGVDIDINEFYTVKNMFYPNPLKEGNEKSKIEFPTERAILENQKKGKDNEKIEEMQKENNLLKENNKKAQEEALLQMTQKIDEINELKRQLEESQSLANKYMSIFRKSFFSRLFGGVNKADVEKDTKLLS